MKATGIVRRIDDLGRIVIPKEIRRTFRIKDGDSLEIFTDSQCNIIFRKYSPIGEMTETAEKYVKILNQLSDKAAIICDCEHIIAGAGLLKKDFTEKRISKDIEKFLYERKHYHAGQDSPSIKPIEGSDKYLSVMYPVIAASDISGAVFTITDKEHTAPDSSEIKLVQAAALLLSSQIEG